ncbi:MAG: hypothetical protein K0R22_2107 [Sporomusa sp.]|jgi:hypothetical protein|nr:hypothetical protein [Sporomusa sp.]
MCPENSPQAVLTPQENALNRLREVANAGY